MSSWPLKQKKLQVNFRLKVFLYFISLVVVISFLHGLAMMHVQQDQLKEHIIHQGRTLINVLARNVQLGLFFEDNDQVKEAVAPILAERDVLCVVVYDSADKVIFQQPDNDKHLGAISQATYALRKNISNGGNNTSEPVTSEDGDAFVFWAPVIIPEQEQFDESIYFPLEPVKKSAEKLIGTVQISLSKEPLVTGRRESLEKTSLLGMLFVLFGSVITFLLARDLATPLSALIRKMRDRGIEVAGNEDEFGLMADNYSLLVSQLDEAFKEIDNLNIGLEEKVEDRTRDLSLALHELKDAQVKLVQSEKMVAMGQLVAGVAHEINNTTNFVSGALPPLTRRLDELKELLAVHQVDCSILTGTERFAKIMASVDLLLSNIQEGSRRTNKIVNDLKTFSRPDEEKMLPVDINACLESTLTLARNEYKYHLELTTELDPTLPVIEGSQGQLNQVFMNLLINCIQAQPNGGEIFIKTWHTEETVHIIFRDKGEGISREHQQKLFDPFFTTKKVGSGTGLGLSITYGIVDKHNGDILVRSEVGQGTEFEIVLPIEQTDIKHS